MKPAVSALFFAIVLLLFVSRDLAEEKARTFGVWAVSCSHVPADIKRGRESLGDAIRQSEGPDGFDWDVMIDAGDLSSSQFPPIDEDGEELQIQYRAMKKHRREQVYNVQGNHDAPYYDDGPGTWFRKWGDPVGENTEFSGVDSVRRPFSVEGDWERYKFVAGNILFLMLSDRNDAPVPVGRGHSSEKMKGGYPPGAVTRDTFHWWKKQVLENQDKIIITMHHHALRDTTTSSGNGEGNPRYHGATGGAAGSSYLYYIIENDDPKKFTYTADAHVFEDFLEDFHRENGRGAIDFWIGGHTHMKGPEDDFGNKTITETRWGVHFLQVAGLTRYHAGGNPMSRLLTFTDKRDEVLVRTWLHDSSFIRNPVGFYKPATRTLKLRHAFTAPPPIDSMDPFPAGAKMFDRKNHKHGKEESRYFKASDSPDLTKLWNRETGRFAIAEQKFDGRQRLRVGPLDMSGWKALIVSVKVKTKRNDPNMRVVSKDRIGTPGNFVLEQKTPDTWVFKAWDRKAKKWASAMWRGNLADGQWHELKGTVDAKSGKVRLEIDGGETGSAEAAFTAETLDDSDEAELVLGADSGEKKYGHTFRGAISDLYLLPAVLE